MGSWSLGDAHSSRRAGVQAGAAGAGRTGRSGCAGGAGSTCTAAGPCWPATVLSRVHAGEEVVPQDGLNHTGELTVPRSAIAAAPIMIRAAAGAHPVLDGSDPQSAT